LCGCFSRWQTCWTSYTAVSSECIVFIISILFNTIRNILPATFGSNTGVDDFVGLQTLNLSWLTSVLGFNRKKRSQMPSYAYEFSCRRYLCALFTNSLTARHIIQSPTRIRTLPASYCVWRITNSAVCLLQLLHSLTVKTGRPTCCIIYAYISAARRLCIARHFRVGQKVIRCTVIDISKVRQYS